MTRVEKLLEILRTEFPDARITLDFGNPLELLIATILAAQCTDERVNEVTRKLFKKYRRVQDYAQADLRELEEDVRPTGFYKSKARSIVGCCKKLIEDFGGQVPRRVENLVTLPGVGRKTANIVLANAFGQSALGVDTHVKRVTNRIGLVCEENPDQIERELCQQIPEAQWAEATHLLVFLGRRVCQAKKPLCGQCKVRDLCDWPYKTDLKSTLKAK